MRKTAATCILILAFFSGLYAADTDTTAPENLNVIYIDNNHFKVIWNASADKNTLTYTLFRSPVSTGGTAVYTGSSLSYDDLSVNTTDAFYYKVRSNIKAESNSNTFSAVRKSLPLPSGIIGTMNAAPQNSKALLTWGANPGTTLNGYSIYRATAADGNFDKLSSVPAEQTQYFDPDIVNGLQYYYKIAGKADDGTEGAILPGPAAAVIPFASPFAPENLTATVSGKNIILSWSAANVRGTYDISHYNFYRSITSPVVDAWLDSFTAAFTDTWPLTGERYDYRVAAVDVNGNISIPAYVTVYERSHSILAATGLAVANITSSRVSLTWSSANQPEQIDGFRISRDGTPLAVTSSTATSYTDDASALTLNVQYNYSIETFRDSAPAAAPVVTGPVPALLLPAAPVNLTISQTGTGRLHLAWAAANFEPASYYNVYRSLTAGDFSTATPVPQTATAYADDTLTAGVIYYYRLATLLNGIESPYTEIQATAITPPVSPLDVTDIGGTTGNGYIHLTWTASADFDAHTFNVYYKLTYAAEAAYVTGGISNTNSAYVICLNNEAAYNFKVTSTNALGTSEITSALYTTLTPDSAVILAAPASLVVDSSSNSRLSLSWDPVIGAVKYNIFRSLLAVVPETPDSLINTTAANSYVDILPFSDNSFYWYKVMAVDFNGNTGAGVTSVTAARAFTRPGPPQNVELSNSAGGIILSWAKPTAPYTFSSALNYRIYSSTYPGVFASAITETAAAYYEDNAANTKAAIIYYRVKSVDANDNEDNGNASYSVQPDQPISPPPVLLASPGNHRVTLNWHKVTPEYYNIYRSTDAGRFDLPIAHNIDFNGREYIDWGPNTFPSLANKTTFYYTIASVTRGGEGPRSVTASAIPYAPPVISNTSVAAATTGTGKEIELDWKIAVPDLAEGYGIDKYNIFRSRDNGWTYSYVTSTPYHAAGALLNDMESYTDTTTAWDNIYTYEIKVQDIKGNVDAAYNPVDITLVLPKNRLKLYANLVDLTKGQSLKWQYIITNGGRIKVNVFTLSGVFVKNLDDEVYSGNATPLNPYNGPYKYWDGTNAKGNKVASGVYLLVFELGNTKSIEKIAVIR